MAPSFITVDSVLQVYHVFYDYSLRRLEAETLTSELTELTDSMYRKSAALYERRAFKTVQIGPAVKPASRYL